MTETLVISNANDRRVNYLELAPQIDALVSGESDLTANLGNIAAALREVFGFFWIGFYLRKDDQLVLNAFQGPVACTRIAFDSGVCGHCYSTGRTIIVPDVDAFPGHIACSSASRSEIVLPIFSADGQIFGVLDVDSDKLNDFSEIDAEGLGKIVKIVAKLI